MDVYKGVNVWTDPRCVFGSPLVLTLPQHIRWWTLILNPWFCGKYILTLLRKEIVHGGFRQVKVLHLRRICMPLQVIAHGKRNATFYTLIRAGMQGRGRWDIPEKTCRPAARLPHAKIREQPHQELNPHGLMVITSSAPNPRYFHVQSDQPERSSVLAQRTNTGSGSVYTLLQGIPGFTREAGTDNDRTSGRSEKKFIRHAGKRTRVYGPAFSPHDHDILASVTAAPALANWTRTRHPCPSWTPPTPDHVTLALFTPRGVQAAQGDPAPTVRRRVGRLPGRPRLSHLRRRPAVTAYAAPVVAASAAVSYANTYNAPPARLVYAAPAVVEPTHPWLPPPLLVPTPPPDSEGTVVAERLDYSPPTKANRVHSPAGSLPDFRKWESGRTMSLVRRVFSEISRFPTLEFRRHSILTHVAPDTQVHIEHNGSPVSKKMLSDATVPYTAVYYENYEEGVALAIYLLFLWYLITTQSGWTATCNIAVSCADFKLRFGDQLCTCSCRAPLASVTPLCAAERMSCGSLMNYSCDIGHELLSGWAPLAFTRCVTSHPAACMNDGSFVHPIHGLVSAPGGIIGLASKRAHFTVNSLERGASLLELFPTKSGDDKGDTATCVNCAIALRACTCAECALRSAGIQGRRKREIPEKIRRPTVSYGTILTCENTVTRPGIEPSSSWWGTSRLTAQPLQIPREFSNFLTRTSFSKERKQDDEKSALEFTHQLRVEWTPLGTMRPRSRGEGAIRVTLTCTASASSLLRARRAVFPANRPFPTEQVVNLQGLVLTVATALVAPTLVCGSQGSRLELDTPPPPPLPRSRDVALALFVYRRGAMSPRLATGSQLPDITQQLPLHSEALRRAVPTSNMYKLVILPLLFAAVSAGYLGAPAVATYAAPAVAAYAAPAVVASHAPVVAAPAAVSYANTYKAPPARLAYAAPAVAAYAAPAIVKSHAEKRGSYKGHTGTRYKARRRPCAQGSELACSVIAVLRVPIGLKAATL
ncbi:hypothetical protein PR048_010448 [Dryococelus australis]|uniref:Uncharacterized protein n=1 Tax=Dryococelus australis TaxID=614101 RepID=A0ABQ9I2Q8_9NEOP|nr:hypothetical protein PR048_010448 [Dryococelus australis]